MFTTIAIILSCAVLHAIKGGQHGFIRNRVENKILHRLLDGKVISSAGFGVLIGIVTGDAVMGASCAVLWLAAFAPSMGEEAGATGGICGGWGPYLDRGFGRSYGVKKALQRGVFAGAILSLLLPGWAMIVAGATFPVCYFIGISIQQLIDGDEKDDASWHIAEWIYGVVIGIGVAFALGV